LEPAAAVALPQALYDHLHEALGELSEGAALAMLQPAPLWLTGYGPDVVERLQAEGATVRAGPLQGNYAVQWRGPL
jgi:hypothetical protein